VAKKRGKAAVSSLSPFRKPMDYAVRG